MGYLVLAVCSSAATSIVMRWGEKHVKNNMGMFFVNYGVCVLLSRLFFGEMKAAVGEKDILFGVILGLLSGALYLGNFISLKNNMKRNGVVLSTTFMKLGVLVPTIMAIGAFGERPSLLQVAGILLALGAIVLIHFEREGIAEGTQKWTLVFLLLISGITDSMANIYDKTGAPALKDHYLFFTFLSACLIALFFTLRKKVGVWEILFGIGIGIPNYFSARFLLLSVGEVPAVIVYPVYSVATMVIISVVGVAAFREKISRKKAVALGLILVALALLHL